MKTGKRVLSVLLAVMMLIAIVPVANVGMTASAYTTPQNVNISTVEAKARELLLKLGGDGSYFTVNKSYCCNPRESRHGCSNCLTTNIVQANWFKSLFGSVSTSQFPIQYYPNGGEGTPAGYSCHGFANFAAWYLFSQNSTDRVTSKKIGEYTLTKANFDNYVWPGDVIRTSSGHSMVVLNWNSSGYIVIDSNYSGPNCQIHIGSRDYSSSTRFAISRATNAISNSSEPSTAPTDLSISINKGSFKVGETATFTFGCNNADGIAIPIDYNGVREQFIWVSGNSYSMQLTKAGQYGFFLYAKNAAGEAASQYEIFYVYDAAPNNMSIATNKKEFPVGDTVTFTYSCDNADRVAIPIDYNGVREQFILVNGGTYSMDLTKAGQYGYFLYAENAVGEAATTYDTFYVYDSAPKDLEISINKTKFQIGETAIFSFNCKNAEEIAIPIDYNGVREQFVLVSGNSYSMKLTKSGQYGVYLYARNRFGEASTVDDYISFVVTCATHTWNSGTVTKAATCSATGVKTYTCTVCGETKTEPININSSNHVNTTNVTATPSTCTVKGYTAGVYCNDCKKYISGHAEQPLAAHTLTTINHRDATYDAEGYTGDEYCTTCKQTITTGTAIPKLERPTDPTPSNPQPSGGCKWCGGQHGGVFGWLVRIIHNILAAIFGAKY